MKTRRETPYLMTLLLSGMTILTKVKKALADIEQGHCQILQIGTLLIRFQGHQPEMARWTCTWQLGSRWNHATMVEDNNTCFKLPTHAQFIDERLMQRA
jgi:hypothetical protein